MQGKRRIKGSRREEWGKEKIRTSPLPIQEKEGESWELLKIERRCNVVDLV
ncbi:hypothetical protein HMPREF9134_01663 [Porphyromonas catoniae F0037]|uniref:Uncharacterized protein n=1 Tax=Porphyromonas catoniae F0037 TaxID=1127696 RepID=L1NA16_9PORP|nr:hypothetical protein HMPREF9134_01663 [Porphyromonas catoniae F0037]